MVGKNDRSPLRSSSQGLSLSLSLTEFASGDSPDTIMGGNWRPYHVCGYYTSPSSLSCLVLSVRNLVP